MRSRRPSHILGPNESPKFWGQLAVNEFRARPVGRRFLRAMLRQEDLWGRAFEDWLAVQPRVDGPDIVEALGSALLFLDTVPSCRYGCELSDGDHTEMHLLTRLSSSARASTRLLLTGYFLEGLAMIRRLMEIVDLMLLFKLSKDSLEKFRNASRSQRDRHFRPGKVRAEIAKLRGEDSQSMLVKDLHHLLSQLSVHNSSTTNLSRKVRQIYDAVGRQGAVAVSQSEYVDTLVALNQVAGTVSAALMLASSLLDHPKGEPAALNLGKELSEVVKHHKAMVEEPGQS